MRTSPLRLCAQASALSLALGLVFGARAEDFRAWQGIKPELKTCAA